MSAFDDWYNEQGWLDESKYGYADVKRIFNAGLEAAVTLAEKQAEWKLAHAIRALKGG